MNLRSVAIVLVALVAGFGAGAWWMQARLAPEIAALEQAAGGSLIAELAKLSGAVPGPQLPDAAGVSGPASPSPTAAAPRDATASSAEASAVPEPPASWMTVEQQRAAALAYRDHVWEQNRQSNERRRNLNAELFLIEGQDPAWGAAMESRVRASMAAHVALKSAALESIECRVTVCRAVVRFADDTRRDGGLPHGGQSPWSAWRGAQIIPVPRSELEDQVPGFRATVYLGDDFEYARLPLPTPRVPAGPGGP